MWWLRLYFFIGIGVGNTFGIIFVSSLPLIGTILIFLDRESESIGMLRTDKSAFEEGVFKKLFIRLIVGIFLVSLAIGVVRGYILFTETAFRNSLLVRRKNALH